MEKTERRDRKIVFENGREFLGEGFGAAKTAVCKAVFDTAMIGYQEIVSDPACAGEGLVMTYPVIGTYGMAEEDYESRALRLACLVVREYNDRPSNFRYTQTLADVMEENNIPGIQGVDTRAITRMLRENGAMKMILTDAEVPTEQALEELKAAPLPTDLVSRVSSRKVWYSRTANHTYHVVAIDCGIRQSSIRCLTSRGCNVTVVPYQTSAEAILAMNPDGVFISSGPGEAAQIPETVKTAAALMGKLPLFGVALGSHVLALAAGGKVTPMKTIHSGGNIPVMREGFGKREFTAQGHTSAVCKDSLKNTCLAVTHRHLLDHTVEGFRSEEKHISGVQYYPENMPDADDCAYHYDLFISDMENAKGGSKNA